MKHVWLLSIFATLLWASPHAQIRDKEMLAQSKYHQNYAALNRVMKKDIDEIYRKKITLIALAQKSGIMQNKTYQEQLEKAKENILLSIYLQKKKTSIIVSESEIKAYYRAHIRDYTLVHAYTIVRRNKEELLPHLDTLKATPKEKLLEVFKTLASHYSQHPRKNRGGDMGYIGLNTIVQPFGKKAFELREGTFTSEPFKTTLGWHLVYVAEQKVKPYEAIKKSVQGILRSQKYKAWFTKL